MSTPTSGQWAPQTPLTVSRLAGIANSFGYNLPSSQGIRRSPSPSPSLSTAYVLQVTPPHDLPNESDILTPPPLSASGYHPNYARGILVPVQPTLQSQLGAIAREFALPSTAGLVLYLVNDPGTSGPRLSEDVWKLLWSRILSSDNTYIPPSTPRTLTLLSPGAYRPSPYSSDSPSNHLNPDFYTPSPRSDSLDSPFPFPPTGPAATISRSFTKSAPPSSHSPTDTTTSPSEPDPETPLTSVDPSTRANSLQSPSLEKSFDLALPGLNNPHALVPILAKVEFDIDKRKATWYVPWLRSRRINHAKRRAAAASSEHIESEDGQNGKINRPIIDLTIGTKDPMPFSQMEGDYAPLAESPVEEHDQDQTVKLSQVDAPAPRDGARDPLSDVFGEDQDEWGHPPDRDADHDNENIVPLALTPQSLEDVQNPDNDDNDDDDGILDPSDEVSEVKEMIMNAVRSPTSTDRGSVATVKKHVPPPLVLRTQSPSGSPLCSPRSSPSRTTLPYLRSNSDGSAENHSVDIEIDRSSIDSWKGIQRRHGVYDDFDVDSDQFEDSVDGKDQMFLKAQLDEIEKTLQQLSPRTITEFENEQMKRDQSASPTRPLAPSLPSPTSDAPSPTKELTNAEALGIPPEPSPTQETEADLSEESSDEATPAWPATPFSVLKQKRMSASSSRSSKSSGSVGVPQLAVNGVSTGGPPVFRQSLSSRRKSNASDKVTESESSRRKREAEEDENQWRQSTSSPPKSHLRNTTVIPLSPDPFGRFSSSSLNGTVDDPRSSTYWEDGHPIAQSLNKTSNSRFSAAEDDDPRQRSTDLSKEGKGANRGTLMSVMGIKKLWRKSSRAGSVSSPPDLPPIPPSPIMPTIPVTGRASPALSTGRGSPVSITGVPQRPSRPQEEIMELPSADDIDVSRLPAMLGGGRGGGGGGGAAREQPRLSATPTSDGQSGQERAPPAMRSAMVPPVAQSVQHSERMPPFGGNMHPPYSHYSGGSIQLHPTGPNGNRPKIGSFAGPILPAKMMPGAGRSKMSTLSFDQETPYPVPGRKPSIPPRKETTRSPSPNGVPSPAPTPPPPSGSPPFSDYPQPKSILKSKSTSALSNSNSSSPSPSPVPAASIARSRRPSVLGRNSSLNAINTPDLPPSPRIPEQYLSGGGGGGGGGQKLGSRSSFSLRSNDSHPSSLRSYHSGGSRSSHDTTEPEELDDSQFEMVSPKLGETKQLSYPYSELNNGSSS